VLTLFTIPKPFVGESGRLQRNALRSWRMLGHGVDIILLGDEVGVADAAREFGALHVPSVAVNRFGTPLLDSAFALAQDHARSSVVAYANADLIFYADFLDAVSIVAAQCERFMLIGRCYDLDVPDEPLDVAGLLALRGRAEAELRCRDQAGQVWFRHGLDYFVFRKRSLGELPSFAVGRPPWDRWMPWRARQLRMDLVEITLSAVVLHQHHGYGHVKQATDDRWEGPEAEANRALVGHARRLALRDAATHRLDRGDLIRNRRGIWRRMMTELVLHDSATPIFFVTRWLRWRLRRFSRAKSS
jgi:hypothetical protein